MKLAIKNNKIVADLTELKAINTTLLVGNEFMYVSSLKTTVVFWKKSGKYQPNDFNSETNIGGWDKDDVGCNSIIEEVADDFNFTTNGKTELIAIDLPLESIYKKPFIETIDLDYRIKGLHKKELYDSNGDMNSLEFYVDYDEIEGTHDRLAIKELRVYTRNTDTGIIVKRITDITFYNNDGTIFKEKLGIEKHYSSKKGFEANKKARQNLIDNASMYLFGALIQNNAGNMALSETQVDDFSELTDAAQSKYIKSNTAPLLAIINTCLDVNSSNYRSYITLEIKANLLVILDIKYTV